MIEKLASNMASFYIRKDIIPQGALDTYKYGFEILISTLCNMALVLIISLLLHSLIGAVFYTFAFIVVRLAGGGYHAKTHWACILSFSITYAIFYLGSRLLKGYLIELYILICAIISSVIIWKIAPVGAPNKPLSTIKRMHFKTVSLAVGSGFMALALVVCLGVQIPDHIIVNTFSGELAAALSMAVVAGIQRKEGIVYEQAVP